MLTLIDHISNRDSPFDLIVWYVILEDDNGNNFFDTFSTSNYDDPLHFSDFNKAIPIETKHIDLYLEMCRTGHHKMEISHYRKIISIRARLERDNTINDILG